MADPTGARHRDFDIPVIIPRVDFLTIPVTPDAPAPVTTATCTNTTTTTTVFVPTVATSTGVKAPKLTLTLPAIKLRQRRIFVEEGIRFILTCEKELVDGEVRLLQLLPGGVKRPLGVGLAFAAAGKHAVAVTVTPTPFAKTTLRLAGKRPLRAIAIVTATDGSVGQAVVDFTLTR